jgi:site-specific recombinase XerD
MTASIIHQFKSYLYQVGYSNTTQRMLPACVAEFIEQQGITDLRWIEQEKVKAFYQWLQIRPLKYRPGGLSEMMISHYVYALKTFFSWLEVTGQSDYNPISGIKFKRAKAGNREPLTLPEITQLFTAVTSLQELALLHLFYSCGLRRSEGEALNCSDLHFKTGLLYVRAGKGAKRRVVPMTEKTVLDLEAYYLQDRCNAQTKTVKDMEAFLLNRSGGRLNGDQCNQRLKDLVNRSAIGKEITLHHLRHSIATHLLQGGMQLEQVRDFLGHYYLETTQIYAKPQAEQLRLL